MQSFAHYAGFAGILAALLGAPAEALPLFEASVSFNGFLIQSNTGNTAVGAEFQTVASAATAIANSSGLSATGRGKSLNSEGAVSGRGVAAATFDDFVISGPPGPVTTSFNMVLSGDLGVLTLAPGGDRLTQATAAVIVQVAINGQIVTGDAFFQDRYRLFSVNGVYDAPQATGMLASWNPVSGVITTPAFTVDAGVPFSLKIELTATGGGNAFAVVEPNLFAEGYSSFGSTLTFAAGPVFNLSAGYTVNSPSAGVSANEFTVPEPSSLGLLLAGTTLVGLRRCRPSRR